MNKICDRCKKQTSITITSMMNIDTLCIDCIEKESLHPRYQEARDAELKQVQNGNYNFKGLFYGKKWPFK